MPFSQSGGGAGGGGTELGYTQITAPVNIASTTEATGTTILSPGAITFDGAPVLLHLFCYQVQTDTTGAGDPAVLSLFEGATQITRLIYTQCATNGVQAILGGLNAFYRFSPTAGSHTYTITAFSTTTTGTPKVAAGNGGTGLPPPSFVRFTKV